MKADLDSLVLFVVRRCCLIFLPVLLAVATGRQTEANINTKFRAILMRKVQGKGTGKVSQLHSSVRDGEKQEML